MEDFAGDLEAFARIIRQQLPFKNRLWLKGIKSSVCKKTGPVIKAALNDIKKHEQNGRSRTWARNAEESRTSAHTMGYHLIRGDENQYPQSISVSSD